MNRKVFEGGASITSPFLLDKINIKNADGSIVKNYKCSYTTVKNQSFLSSFTETGSDGRSSTITRGNEGWIIKVINR